MSTKDIIRQFEPKQHNLLHILHALQDAHPENYITKEALEAAARHLGVTKSTVYGVARYYTMFSIKPRGKYVIRVCASPVCELLHVNDVIAALEQELKINTGDTTTDGLFTLELSECLGQCQEAPSMMINDKVHNNLTPARIREIIQSCRDEASRVGG